MLSVRSDSAHDLRLSDVPDSLIGFSTHIAMLIVALARTGWRRVESARQSCNPAMVTLFVGVLSVPQLQTCSSLKCGSYLSLLSREFIRRAQ
jgi:hypothetical protein